MDLLFYEMHFEATDQLKLEGNTDNNSFSLVCMTSEGDTFCSINDKVYHILWSDTEDELERRLCYTPSKDATSQRMREITLLDTLHSTTTTTSTTIMAVVYFHGGKYTLSVFQLDLPTLKIKYRQEETLHGKPNLVRLSRDLFSSNTAVFATFYSEPCVTVYTYTSTGFLSKTEDIKVKEHYPGLFKCMYHAAPDKRTLSRDDHHLVAQDKRMAQDYILCIDVLIEGDVRYLAFGTVDGNIHIHVTNPNGCLWQALYDWEGPISAVKMFKVKGFMCLLGGCMVEQAVLFTDINANNKLSNRTILPESTLFDSITCLNIMDIDYDGDSEIMIGTYGRMFLVYKLYISDGMLVPHIVYRRTYNSPVYGICYSDITDDGLHEIIVLTFDGIHILQRCLRSAQLYIQKLLHGSNQAPTNCPYHSEHSGDTYASTPEFRGTPTLTHQSLGDTYANTPEF